MYVCMYVCMYVYMHADNVFFLDTWLSSFWNALFEETASASGMYYFIFAIANKYICMYLRKHVYVHMYIGHI
jgi:hypothetical protein